MQQVFVEDAAVVENRIEIIGEDAIHLARVLRMRKGEVVRISTQSGVSYLAELAELSDELVVATVTETEVRDTELPGSLWLFQALPKGDRLETVVEKAVELGATDIVPVAMDHCIMKWDGKQDKKQQRYQTIADTAAKQSKRSRLATFHGLVKFEAALKLAQENCDILILPYENARGMEATAEVLSKIKKESRVAVFIGPEGGFSEREIEQALPVCEVISLGGRILRTDTAAIVSCSMVMLRKEMQ